jgi:hypothetical protein
MKEDAAPRISCSVTSITLDNGFYLAQEGWASVILRSLRKGYSIQLTAFHTSEVIDNLFGGEIG